MRTRWMVAAAGALLGAACFTACAGATNPSLGSGGTDAATTTATASGGPDIGSGGGGGVSSSSSSSTASAGGSSVGGGSGTGGSLCGNGVLDPGEACDGTEFGALTCESLGLGAGQLQCNTFCGVVAAACTPAEDCNNGEDDDNNGLTDCDDPACVAAPACLDSCFSVAMTSPGNFEDSTTVGRPSVHHASCSGAVSGAEVFYQLDATTTQTLLLSLTSFDAADFSLSLRTACGDDTTELDCANKFGPNDTHAESLTLHAIQGQSYFIMIQGVTAADAGSFTLEIDVAPAETKCANLLDDDSNGFTDCDDPACQATAACMPGAVVTGQPCTAHKDCTANHHDPVCLQGPQGFPGGYCSEFCDMVAQDCAVGSLCYGGFGLSTNGVCLASCVVDADCRTGYSCHDKGLSSKVCTF